MTRLCASAPFIVLTILSLIQAANSQPEEINNPTATRLGNGPIITQYMDDRMSEGP
jgi:hypothetical protein